MPPMSSVSLHGRQALEAEAPVPAWRALQTGDVTRFRAEGVAVDEKEKCCLADFSAPQSCSQVGVPSDCGLGFRIWFLDHIEECGGKIAGRRFRRSDRGVHDLRSI